MSDRRGPRQTIPGDLRRPSWKHRMPASLQTAGRRLRVTSAAGQVKPRPRIPESHARPPHRRGGCVRLTPQVRLAGSRSPALEPGPTVLPAAWTPTAGETLPSCAVSPPRGFGTHETQTRGGGCVTSCISLQGGTTPAEGRPGPHGLLPTRALPPGPGPGSRQQPRRAETEWSPHDPREPKSTERSGRASRTFSQQDTAAPPPR